MNKNPKLKEIICKLIDKLECKPLSKRKPVGSIQKIDTFDMAQFSGFEEAKLAIGEMVCKQFALHPYTHDVAKLTEELAAAEKALKGRTKDEIHALIEKYGDPQYKTSVFALYDLIVIVQLFQAELNTEIAKCTSLENALELITDLNCNNCPLIENGCVHEHCEAAIAKQALGNKDGRKSGGCEQEKIDTTETNQAEGGMDGLSMGANPGPATEKPTKQQ